MKNKIIYADNAATTEIKSEVLDVMSRYLFQYGNPSSMYNLGIASKRAIDNARNIIADSIGAKPEEIYFTSGGSESDNWALKGAVKPGEHIITSQIEHHAILNTCKYLESIGVEVTYIKPNEDGFITATDVFDAIRDNTKLVSIMTANNETGALNDIASISKLIGYENRIRADKILIHTDAVQAMGHIKVNVDEFGVDMLSVSGHKFGAPKGIGFLYIRKGTEIEPLIHGGKQENGLRGGTENVAAIVGLAEAVKTIQLDKNMNALHFINCLKNKDVNFLVNCPEYDCLNNTVNLSFPWISGEQLVYLLDERGIQVSSGSACASGTGELSHVLTAMGFDEDRIKSSIRFSFRDDITYEELNYIANAIAIFNKMIGE